jgi:hypothetical protein
MIYRFEVTYVPVGWVETNSLLRKLDLGIEKMGTVDTFEIKASHEEPKTESMKKLLKGSLEGLGCEVVDIKGGVWE